MPRHWNDLNRAGNYSQGLLGQNSPSSFRSLLGSGRVNLIGDSPGRPDSASGFGGLTAATGSYTSRNAAPGMPAPPSPRTFRREGRKVSDIVKDAKLGQYGPAQLGEYGPEQFRQFGPGAPSPMEAPASEGIGDPGPQGFASKIGGFLNKPGIGQSMMAAGARMMQGSPDGTFATIGQGLEAGLGAYQGLRERRLLEEDADRTRTQEDEDRATQKKVNDSIQEITGGWDENTTPEQMISDYQKAANIAFGNGDSPLGRALLEAARLMLKDPEGGSDTSFTNYDRIRYRDPNGRPTRGRKRTVVFANGEVEQTFEYLDEGVLKENLDEGMSPADAQVNAWLIGGGMADPSDERRVAEEGETSSAQERLNNNLKGAALSGLRGLVVDATTGEPNYLDYRMAGAVPVYDQEQNIVDWERGGIEHLETWQALLGDWISNAGSEVVGGPTKFVNMIIRSELPTDIQMGYTEALNYINPTVRFLSGAQMTNQEAMRYYNALMPMPGDDPRTIELKRRKRDVLTNAMGGEGISEEQKREAREILGIAFDADMSHAFGDFGIVDDTGVYAMEYYLARLNEHPTLGNSNTFTGDELRRLGSGAGGGGSTPGGAVTFDISGLEALTDSTGRRDNGG